MNTDDFFIFFGWSILANARKSFLITAFAALSMDVISLLDNETAVSNN